jgi:hypothetical protein
MSHREVSTQAAEKVRAAFELLQSLQEKLYASREAGERFERILRDKWNGTFAIYMRAVDDWRRSVEAPTDRTPINLITGVAARVAV